MRLANKIAIVTGAGSGIGRASAIALAREGARVVVVDNRWQAAEQTVAQIRQAGGTAILVEANVACSEDVRSMVSRAGEQFGTIDVLHNNAGVPLRRAVTEQDEEGWDECLRVNLKSAFLCSKYTIPHMLEKGGSIIHTASVTGMVGVRNRAGYSATKGAIISLTRNMALDYAQYGIRVNCICPGFTRTPFIARLLEDPEKARMLTALHPLGRLGTPEDIAHAVVFFASDESAWITGQALAIDGGFSVGRPEDI